MDNQVEELRRSAHSIVEILHKGDVGGACYQGKQHGCFAKQGRRPLRLYNVENMCERCAAAWHAAMTATLLDSLMVGQRFTNGATAAAPPLREPKTAAAKPTKAAAKPAVPTCRKCGRTFSRKNAKATHERFCKA